MNNGFDSCKSIHPTWLDFTSNEYCVSSNCTIVLKDIRIFGSCSINCNVTCENLYIGG
jgi:hypothetical protein